MFNPFTPRFVLRNKSLQHVAHRTLIRSRLSFAQEVAMNTVLNNLQRELFHVAFVHAREVRKNFVIKSFFFSCLFSEHFCASRVFAAFMRREKCFTFIIHHIQEALLRCLPSQWHSTFSEKRRLSQLERKPNIYNAERKWISLNELLSIRSDSEVSNFMCKQKWRSR